MLDDFQIVCWLSNSNFPCFVLGQLLCAKKVKINSWTWENSAWWYGGWHSLLNECIQIYQSIFGCFWQNAYCTASNGGNNVVAALKARMLMRQKNSRSVSFHSQCLQTTLVDNVGNTSLENPVFNNALVQHKMYTRKTLSSKTFNHSLSII